jgi:hypothetical protein
LSRPSGQGKAHSELDLETAVRRRIQVSNQYLAELEPETPQASPETTISGRPSRTPSLLPSLMNLKMASPARLSWSVIGVAALVSLALFFIRIADHAPSPVADLGIASEPAHLREAVASGNVLAPPLVVDVSGLDPPIAAERQINAASERASGAEVAGAQTTLPEQDVVRSATVRPPAGYTGATLRDAPSTRGHNLRVLPNGTRIELLKETAQGDGFLWLNIRTQDGLVGWIVAPAVA